MILLASEDILLELQDFAGPRCSQNVKGQLASVIGQLLELLGS